MVVLRALGLGDMLTAVPALRGLRRAYPGLRIVLCTPSWLTPIARASGAVDEIADARALKPLLHPPQHPALAVNLHGRGPESHLVLEQLRPEASIAFHHPAVGWSAGMPAWRPGEHEVHRWCRMLAEAGIDSDPCDLHLARPAGRRDSGLSVIHAGAASASRRWPAERFARIALAERRKGRTVALTGTPDDLWIRRRIAALARSGGIFVAHTTLEQLMELVAGCGRVVCGDTGVAHLATALRTPSVVLFGPTSPAEWGPPPSPLHRVLWCGRSGDPHGAAVDPGLLDITPEDVEGALDSLDRLAA
jgi:ADP-heptose:LPS heptosyltransferase